MYITYKIKKNKKINCIICIIPLLKIIMSYIVSYIHLYIHLSTRKHKECLTVSSLSATERIQGIQVEEVFIKLIWFEWIWKLFQNKHILSFLKGTFLKQNSETNYIIHLLCSVYLIIFHSYFHYFLLNPKHDKILWYCK